ncbi:MAG: hypothetical protein WBP45_11930 [Daejeonella sp.]
MMKFLISLLILMPLMQSNAQSIEENRNSGEILTPQNFTLLENYIQKNGKKDEYKTWNATYKGYWDIIYKGHTRYNRYNRFKLRKINGFTNIEISELEAGKKILSSYFISNNNNNITLKAKDLDKHKSELVYQNALTDLAKHLDYIGRVNRGERKLAFFKQNLKKDLTIKQIYQIFGEPDEDVESAMMMMGTYFIDEGEISISIIPHNSLPMRAYFSGEHGGKKEIIIGPTSQKLQPDIYYKINLYGSKSLRFNDDGDENLSIGYSTYIRRGEIQVSLSLGDKIENLKFYDSSIPTTTYWNNFEINIEEVTENYILLKVEETRIKDILTSKNFDLFKNYLLKYGEKDKDPYKSGADIFFYKNNDDNMRFELRETKDSASIEISKIIKSVRPPSSTYSFSINAGEISFKQVKREDSNSPLKFSFKEDDKYDYIFELRYLRDYLDYIKRLNKGERTLAFFKQRLNNDLTIKQLYQIFGKPDSDSEDVARKVYYFWWRVDEGRIFIIHKENEIIQAILKDEADEKHLEVIIPKE